MVSLSYDSLKTFTVSCLRSLGLSESSAFEVTDIFLRAHWRDQKHHDFSLLPQRLGWLFEKRVSATAEPEVTFEDHGAAVLDGHNCLGELGCHRALNKAIDLAAKYTIGLTTIRNSNHYLAGSPYGEIAGEKGMLALLVSSTDRTMAGPSGGPGVLGNNPIAFGAPLEERPFLLDICMAYASLGTLNRMRDLGQSLPDFFGFDKEGNPSGDPGKILEGGSLAPIAQHKGFGLALMVEILTGGLNQGQIGLDIPPGGGIGGHSQTVIAINLKRFPGSETFGFRFETMINQMNEVHGNIRYPGSRRTGWQNENLRSLCKLRNTTYDALMNWGIVLGVEFPWVIEKD